MIKYNRRKCQPSPTVICNERNESNWHIVKAIERARAKSATVFFWNSRVGHYNKDPETTNEFLYIYGTNKVLLLPNKHKDPSFSISKFKFL